MLLDVPEGEESKKIMSKPSQEKEEDPRISPSKDRRRAEVSSARIRELLKARVEAKDYTMIAF